MALKPIGLSFKNTKEDIELYKWIIEHSNKSGFIKDILRAAKESKPIEKKVEDKQDSLIDLNF